MSGHSKWATIKRQKGANDAKRGAIFTKLGNAIAIAAKGGGDPALNPTLALAIQKAKESNMPNANIERSIKRGTGELGGSIIEEMIYEGYGPGGIAVIVECASDNRNRTYSDVRSAFSKHGGNIAESGAVAFQFKRMGVIRVMSDNPEDDLLKVIDAGAEDAIEEGSNLIVYTDMKDLHKVQQALEAEGMKIDSAELAYIPNTIIQIEEESVARKAIALMEALDEIDDITETYSNFDIADSISLS